MNIETEYIKSLLARYYDGSSALDEERILREYFAGTDTDPALETDRAVFAALAAPASAPAGLRAAVEKAVDTRAAKEVSKRLRPHYGRIAAAAAVIVAAISAGVHFFGPQPDVQEMTPEEARQHTIMALSLLTNTVREGCEAMETGAQTTSSSFQAVQTTFEQL